MTIDVPAGVSTATREAAERHAVEAAVLTLWNQEALTIREAAEELGITYREFLELATSRGLPIERGGVNLNAIDDASQKLGTPRS